MRLFIGFILFLFMVNPTVNAGPPTKLVDSLTKVEIQFINDLAVSLKDAELEDPQLVCLAENIYHEARGQSIQGQVAVAMVTLNRVKSDMFPNTICDVVKQGPHVESWKTRNDPNLQDWERVYYPRRHRCQFSWYCDGKHDRPAEVTSWCVSQAIAILITSRSGKIHDLTHGATHYHADYVNPDWADVNKRVAIIGDHIFYKMR
jgi:N-acetylmuramoyl-L-alanine amidase